MTGLAATARTVAAMTAAVTLALAASCAPTPSDSPAAGDGHTIEQDTDMTTIDIDIDIHGTMFTAQLEDNATARAFLDLLPTTLTMDELNGNEKYHYLDSSLPSEPQRVGTIHAGDIMLYGSDCIVLFYQTFRTPYSYTRIGSIADPGRLAHALGAGAASVTFTPEQAA